MDKKIYVYADIQSQPALVGCLWSRNKNGRESATFEYTWDWLNHPQCFAIEPSLLLIDGPQHTPVKKTIFGALGDSAPDRWGRMLMRRAERHRAEAENTTPRTLMEVDYLLMVSDEIRQGALRFSFEKDGPFLSNDTKTIPPLIALPKLLSATERVTNHNDDTDDLQLLLAPGSSLGGARPKASVRDKNGQLTIAKFPSKHDSDNIVLWEGLALTLAANANIDVPDWRIEWALNKPVLLSHRFDRSGKNRIPYLSAMSMLGANDNEQRSYLEIADLIRQHGNTPTDSLHQLWRRIVFNIMISNTDDHLRNHGFLYPAGSSGWQLSPAFDLNPVPSDIKPRILSTTIDPFDGTASLALALSVAEYFDLDTTQADAIAYEVATSVANWRREAARLGLRNTEINRMASAFDHDDLRAGLKLNKK